MATNEIIQSIREVDEVKRNLNQYYPGSYDEYAGYEIVTNRHTYHVLIDSDQQCCENWGYMTTLDNPDEYIGAELLAVTTTDDQLATTQIEKSFGEYADTMFVTFETNLGRFQITLYNEHNGYYAHNAIVTVDGNVTGGAHL